MNKNLYDAWYIREDLNVERFQKERELPMFVKHMKLNVGNYFRSKEEAQRVADAIKTLVNLKKP